MAICIRFSLDSGIFNNSGKEITCRLDGFKNSMIFAAKRRFGGIGGSVVDYVIIRWGNLGVGNILQAKLSKAGLITC
jgi:hypothetical protein